ncbi:MAG: hemerythrin family protein [Clostridia bacterium]|nr:hemerythrin family protein [Clostridia bacterium]MCI1958762.1 hemerythrin family protein [Clostridia bacterium]MCI1999856.1 hemerythrin family protein [Clostridia bacterium]MCI2014228.1 hemerythrin family protein [Clostridia bacterium]
MLWKDKYELGVPLIDRQHKELFKRVEEFIVTLRSSASWEDKLQRVDETLEFMKGYVVEHFHDEEEYQKKIGYPGYNEHRKIHADMVKYVVNASKEYEQGNHSEVYMQQLAGKLLSWLINHVAAEDQRIAKYAIEKGVANDEQ